MFDPASECFKNRNYEKKSYLKNKLKSYQCHSVFRYSNKLHDDKKKAVSLSQENRKSKQFPELLIAEINGVAFVSMLSVIVYLNVIENGAIVVLNVNVYGDVDLNGVLFKISRVLLGKNVFFL